MEGWVDVVCILEGMGMGMDRKGVVVACGLDTMVGGGSVDGVVSSTSCCGKISANLTIRFTGEKEADSKLHNITQLKRGNPPVKGTTSTSLIIVSCPFICVL